MSTKWLIGIAVLCVVILSALISLTGPPKEFQAPRAIWPSTISNEAKAAPEELYEVEMLVPNQVILVKPQECFSSSLIDIYGEAIAEIGSSYDIKNAMPIIQYQGYTTAIVVFIEPKDQGEDSERRNVTPAI